MKIIRIGKDKNLETETDRISFVQNDEQYTITPDHDGFRIHKHPMTENERICVSPAFSNEIIVK